MQRQQDFEKCEDITDFYVIIIQEILVDCRTSIMKMAQNDVKHRNY